MKYEMKHAKKPDKKRKTVVKRKTIVITLSTVAAVAAAALIILNFQVIYTFVNSKIGNFTNILSVKTGEKSEEIATVTEGRKVENTSKEDKTDEELPEEGLLEKSFLYIIIYYNLKK